MKTFRDRVAAITGASSGIGRALALELAERGCDLALASNSHPDRLRETADAAQAKGVKVSVHKVDVRHRDQVENFAARARAEHQRIHLIFNNAGVSYSGTVEGTRIEDYETVMAVNFWGVVYGTKAFLPLLIESGYGHVINISSVFGLFAQPGMSAYNASKFAVRGFTESLRQELDLAHNGVSATCVHPGGVKTRIAESSGVSESVSLVTGEDAEASRRLFDRMLLMPPEVAARTILRGVQRNQRRVLVGIDAHAADTLQRALPSLYQRVMTDGVRMLKRAPRGWIERAAGRAAAA